ncbi:MAG: hypothetical protein V2I43_09190 [Parvularcula sp.]|jgi:hypothetical protein|nr:hypothetical protein [Parvularcula sp.]
MSELARIANQIKKLDSLIFRMNRKFQENPDHPAMPHNIQGLEATRRQLQNRFLKLADRQWQDVCTYNLRAHDDSFISVRSLSSALTGFNTALSLTVDAVMQGRPKDRGHLSSFASDHAALRLGYTDSGPNSGDFAFTMVVERGKELFEPVNASIDKLFSLAECDDTPQIHNYAQELGPAPIRAVAEWCHQHVRSGLDARLNWVQGTDIKRTLAKSVEQWQELKENIELVSDSMTEQVEVVGTLIAANIKTRAFVVQSEKDYISGKFREGVVSKGNTASIPKDYKFVLERTERRNYATERTSVSYTLVALNPIRSS